MTVSELIERLKTYDQNAAVWILGGFDCDVPCEPEPAFDPDNKVCPGVYL